MAKTKKKKPPARKVEVDFSDEESVAAAMAIALEVDPDDIKIKSSHLESFGTGTYWRYRSDAPSTSSPRVRHARRSPRSPS